MPRASNQKLKLLYLLRYLMRETDQEHPVTVQQMIDELNRQGITAERKSVYDDIEALRLFGADIVQVREKQTGYYIGQRDFELPELKLLVDSIQSSKFITQKKTMSLIKKVEGLASVHDAQVLERQVYVRNRVKSMNESVYYNVDEISSAINRDTAIRFRYFEFTPEKERLYRHGGAYYKVSPFALMWDEENYYMLAFDSETRQLRHYRVDKMTHISALDQPREGKESFEGVDMSSYSQKVFGMFAGQEEQVRLRFRNHLAGAVIDRFGKDLMLFRDGPEHFTVTVEVVASPQFCAWIFGFGDEVEILAPQSLRERLRDQAAALARLYTAE